MTIADTIIKNVAERIAKDTKNLQGEDVDARRIVIIEAHLERIRELLTTVGMVEALHKPNNAHPPDGCAICCALRMYAKLVEYTI